MRPHRSADRNHVKTARLKAVASLWFQRVALTVFLLSTIPPVALMLRARESVAALAADRVTWELLGTLVSIVATILVQKRVAQDGCFGACGYPPMVPVRRGAILWLRLGAQCLFWSAMIFLVLTMARALPKYLGIVLSVGLLALWGSAFGGACLAFGFEQAVPPRLRFWFGLDKRWMGSRIWGMINPGERTCVATLKNRFLSLENRLVAMELIELRRWVPGGMAAIQEIAEIGTPPELAARAREIIQSETFGMRPRPIGPGEPLDWSA